jgi:hypothetical protein
VDVPIRAVAFGGGRPTPWARCDRSPAARVARSINRLALAAPGFADEAGEPLHFRPSLAVGGFILFPSAPSEANAKPDPALSFELSLEIGRAFLAAIVLFNSNATGAGGSFEAGAIGGRAGYFFLEGPTAPWASLGLASLHESVITQQDFGTQFSHDGAAVLLERVAL